MGNTSNWVLVILAIELFMGMIALSIASVDPSSQLLLGNKLFGTNGDSQDNVVVSNVVTSGGVSTYAWNQTQFDGINSGDNAIVSSASSAFPDWIRAGFNSAMGGFRTYVNFVGAPFTILSSIGLDSELSALIGAFFGIFGTFIMLNWLLGRDN